MDASRKPTNQPKKGFLERTRPLWKTVVFYYSSLPVLDSGPSLEAELAPKREVPPGEATALEALLRGDSVLEKKSNLCKEEETLLEIQVFL